MGSKLIEQIKIWNDGKKNKQSKMEKTNNETYEDVITAEKMPVFLSNSSKQKNM